MEREHNKFECQECTTIFNVDELNDNLFCPQCTERLSPVHNEEQNLLKEKDIVEENKKDEEVLCKKHIFNRSWFDRKDPSERIGEYLSCFSLYQVYNDVKESDRIKNSIYNRSYAVA